MISRRGQRHYLASMGTGYMGLALSVLGMAKRDMQRGRNDRYRKARRDAVVWLASSQASFWFEATDIEQKWGLSRMGWPEHARALLERDGLDVDERELVRETLDNWNGKDADR